jgi:hypothetical protein
MKTPVLIAAMAALPFALSACQPVKPITRLDCPETQGRLTRVSAASDGRSCAYRADGDLVLNLQLLPVKGSPAAALEPLEADLRAKAGAADRTGPTITDTNIDLPGLHVRTNEGDDEAEVKVGPVTIKADGDGAQVKTGRDVRLKGQSLSPTKNGYRASFLLAGQSLKNGYRVIGYEVAGPRQGPLVVGVYTAKEETEDLEVKDDIERLIRRNGGV